MKSWNRFIVGLSALALGAVFVNCSSRDVFADEDRTGLQVSPVIERMELDPGSTYSNKITISNTGDSPLTFEMSTAPYTVSDKTYAPIYDVRNSFTQIANWITFAPYNDTLNPGELSVVEYTISVPYDAPGGGQYAVIFAETKDATGEAQSVRANAKAGMIVRAKLSGVTRETGSIKDTKIPGFLLSPPVKATITLENTGNVDADVKAVMKIENYFSGELIYDGATDPVEKTILPGTTRDLEISWANVPRLGVLKVTLNTTYLNDSEVKTRVVVVCPVWFIALIALIILAIVVRILARKHDAKKTRKNSKNSEGGSGNFNL